MRHSSASHKCQTGVGCHEALNHVHIASMDSYHQLMGCAHLGHPRHTALIALGPHRPIRISAMRGTDSAGQLADLSDRKARLPPSDERLTVQ
jgi:hypothetical protein